MSINFDCLGLQEFDGDEEAINGIVGITVKLGQPITGYRGVSYYRMDFGAVQIFARARNSKKRVSIIGFDTHSVSFSIWEAKIAMTGLTPKDSDELQKRIAISSQEGKGLAVVDILGADVLPSYFDGEKIKVQMVGLANYVRYYENEDAYAEDQEKNEEGKVYLIEEGTIFPSGMLHNRMVRLDGTILNEIEPDDEMDSFSVVRGTVKELYKFKFNLQEETAAEYICCTLDTEFGELGIVHAYNQLQKSDIKNMQVGATVLAVVVLSGDVAIEEYEAGIVRDTEHDLRVLRSTLAVGEAERLESVLAEDCVYVSEASDTKLVGAKNIIEHINTVQETTHYNLTRLGTLEVEEGEEDNVDFEAGTRCIALYDKNDKDAGWTSLVIINHDQEGQITQITITTDERYSVNLD